ncbi:hypothetical protein ACI2JI_08155 [Enterobacter cancerogenus]|uniref:hypothetical protein n=1 Tax=Enterobacter cancerogenus TaxID=69218 RepID=UPI00384A6FCB
MLKKLIFITILSSTVILSACAPNQKMIDAQKEDDEFSQAVKNINLETADVGTQPNNYQALVESAVREKLKDPDSAKFSNYTNPHKEVMVENHKFIYGYSTCVLVNAKNSYGGYTGNQLYWAFIRNDKVLRIQNTSGAYGGLIFRGRAIDCN